MINVIMYKYEFLGKYRITIRTLILFEIISLIVLLTLQLLINIINKILTCCNDGFVLVSVNTFYDRFLSTFDF